MPVDLSIVESTTELGQTVVEVVLDSASTPGPAGPGVPTGGTVDQVLTKDSGTDYDTSWQDVEAAIDAAPTDATYLVTTGHVDLDAEVVVGATPGGELGGTWASPTVDATHSGSSHAATQAAAEATASAALSSHEGDTTSVHGLADTSVLATDSEVATAVSDHSADTTAVHGIADTSALALTANHPTNDGWTDDSAATWTRTADQTFTVTGDRTAVFSKGTRLKWTQTTVKYGVVILSSHAAGTTTVTIATNTDHVLTAAAISLNSYSYAINPQGYPVYFNYTPSWTSAGTAPALVNGTLNGRFQVNGDQCVVSARFAAGSSTTFGTGVYSFSYPVPEADLAAAPFPGLAWAFDASTGSYPGFWRAGSVAQLATVPASFWTNLVPFTWNSGDAADFRHSYRI